MSLLFEKSAHVFASSASLPKLSTPAASQPATTSVTLGASSAGAGFSFGGLATQTTAAAQQPLGGFSFGTPKVQASSAAPAQPTPVLSLGALPTGNTEYMSWHRNEDFEISLFFFFSVLLKADNLALISSSLKCSCTCHHLMLQEAESSSEIQKYTQINYRLQCGHTNSNNWAEGQALPAKLHVSVEYVHTLTEKEIVFSNRFKGSWIFLSACSFVFLLIFRSGSWSSCYCIHSLNNCNQLWN